jgi:hypothetical protein
LRPDSHFDDLGLVGIKTTWLDYDVYMKFMHRNIIVQSWSK